MPFPVHEDVILTADHPELELPYKCDYEILKAIERRIRERQLGDGA